MGTPFLSSDFSEYMKLTNVYKKQTTEYKIKWPEL